MRPRRSGAPAVALAVVLALSTVAGCTDGGAAPGASPTGVTASPTLPDDDAARRIPIDGTATAPVRWRLADIGDAGGGGAGDGDAAGAVLAARRFVALEYHSGTTADLAGVVPLFAAVTTGDLARVWTAPVPSTSGPPRLGVGPLYVWVLGAVPVSRDAVAVDVCRDFGWSGRGTPPTSRGARHDVVRLVVQRVGGAWKVSSVGPATPAGARGRAAECASWSESHRSPTSPP